jgi:imidazolonepropionase-like amidohydrolase
MQAIQAATVNAGEALGREKDVGAIEVGRYADIIAVATDPLKDVKSLQNVLVVIKGGAIAKDDR